jgi:zinc ribbon protein
MAFCNSCGATIDSSTRFCSKCGAPILASTLPPSAGTNPAPRVPPGTVPVANLPQTNPPQGGGALKIILIAVGVIVLLGAVTIASLAFFAFRYARHAHVRQDGDNVKVDSPFGSVETNKDPAEVARNLGVDLYPGAEVQPNGSASASFGGIHTASLNAESSDSADKICSFYKAKFPNPVVTSSEDGRCTIVSNDHSNIVTINIHAEGDKTKIQISNVTRK